MMNRKALPHAIVCFAWLLVACGGAAPATMPPSSPGPLLGQPAPMFSRPTIQGGHIDTEAAAGRVLVIEFFARYCRPCQKRLPAAEKLRAALPDVVVIGISLDEAPDIALEQVRRYGLGFPVVHDAGQVLAGRFRVAELPIALVVGGDGRVRWIGGPGQSDDALRRAVLATRREGTSPATSHQ